MARKVSTQIVIEGKNNSKAAFDDVARSVDSINDKLKTAGQAAGAYLSASAFVGMVKGIAETSDAFNLMNARLKLATSSQQEFNTAQTELARIAKQVSAPVESLYSLYGSISRPLKEAGRSQADILNITEAVSTAMRVSGTSAQAADAAIIQFSQAMAAGALRGDEFNSVNEAAPRLMQALADGLNVSRGALRGMAEQGKLTADVVGNALIGQLTRLRTEAATMPETVGGAMTQLQDSFNQVVGSTDMTPLIEQLKELATVLKDPEVSQGIGLLTAALVKLAALGVKATSGFANFGQEIGRTMADLTGQITRADIIDREIALLEARIASVPEAAAEGLRQQLATLKAEKDAIIKVIAEQTQQMKQQADTQATQAEQANKAQITELQEHRNNLKRVREQIIADLDVQISAAQDRLRASNSKVKSALDQQLAIQKEFAAAVKGIQAGPASDASFGDVQAMKVNARNALQAGDTKSAIDQARQGIAALQQLQQAGENSYGFAGLAKEFEKMANEAAAVEAANAQAQQTVNTAALDELLAKQATLAKTTTLSFGLDTSSVDALRTQLSTLADDLKSKMVIPVTVTASADMAGLAAPVGTGAVSFPGFAEGGPIRGPGTGTSDSILARLSNGEFVMRAAAVQRYGTALLERMNGLHIPKFADGGLVGGAVATGGDDSYLGTMDLALPGGDALSVSVPTSQRDQLRILRRKYGRTRTN